MCAEKVVLIKDFVLMLKQYNLITWKIHYVKAVFNVDKLLQL